MTRSNKPIQAISPTPNAKSNGMQASKTRPSIFTSVSNKIQNLKRIQGYF